MFALVLQSWKHARKFNFVAVRKLVCLARVTFLPAYRTMDLAVIYQLLTSLITTLKRCGLSSVARYAFRRAIGLQCLWGLIEGTAGSFHADGEPIKAGRWFMRHLTAEDVHSPKRSPIKLTPVNLAPTQTCMDERAHVTQRARRIINKK